MASEGGTIETDMTGGSVSISDRPTGDYQQHWEKREVQLRERPQPQMSTCFRQSEVTQVQRQGIVTFRKAH